MSAAEPGRAGRQTEEAPRILIAASDAELVALVRDRLDGDGREVVVAGSTEAARQRLAEERFSMLLLDLELRDGTARSLLGALRERPGTATMPIIVVGSPLDTAEEAELYGMGADQFLARPLDPVLLRAAALNKLRRAADIRRESRQDALTGLPNRAAFAEAYERALALARRNGESLAVAMLDLDHFKSINDRFGHAQGDDVLRHLSAMVGEVLRRSDLLARWGGEEFVILLPNTDAGGAERALANVQERVRRARWTTGRGEEFRVTFSAGIADASSGAPLAEVISRADYFLYLAKATGRDRVVSEENEVAPRRSRVLLVQRDDLTASLIRHRLSREGLQVVHHTSHESAARAAAADIALVIIDVSEPGLDGFALLMHLRSREDYADVPILLLTSLGSEAEIVRGLELGASDCVVKPFSAVDLVARVQRHVLPAGVAESGRQGTLEANA